MDIRKELFRQHQSASSMLELPAILFANLFEFLAAPLNFVTL